MALFAASAVTLTAAVRRDLDTPVPLAPVAYVQAETCARCHAEHYRSWRRTFHRTMTQEATPTSVLGDFADASLTYQGTTSRFVRAGDDYVIETLAKDGQMRRFKIDRTVGSRRVQQYVTTVGDRHLRLPLAWNIEDRRWFHLNGGFLHPDGSDFNVHLALWDANCIFCHNTKARPGYDWERQTFHSSTEQLGIGCESCHGPGAEHVARNASPLRRYYQYLSDRRDPSIVNPVQLSKQARLQICGHCHGQRLPRPAERIREFLSAGDPYTAGDDLDAYTAPIWRDSKLPGVDLTLRFWADGTPRLTAYEYQSLLLTADYQRGELTCISCHTMHGGDPRGMIEDKMRGPEACLQCHADLRADIPAHTKHRGDSTGSDCYACHMPKIVYGILEVHPTHRIQRPDPSRAWRYDMPEACTVCHTNRTASWAARALSRQYRLPLPPDVPEGAVAETVRALLAGDVVQRAVAARALAAERSYTGDAVERLWVVPFLLLTLEDDYPAIRRFAYQGLRAVVARAGSFRDLPEVDVQSPPETRRAAVARWWTWWRSLDKKSIPHPGPEVPLDERLELVAERVDALRRLQNNNSIAIGE
jgi:predicted CXXCH cytochrome family protein